MPYYHKKDGGKISLLSRKCSKCGKIWSISALFIYPPPKDMTKYIIEPRGSTFSKGSKKLFKIPGVEVIAQGLPNWPRWVRILSACLLLFGIVCLFLLIVRGF